VAKSALLGPCALNLVKVDQECGAEADENEQKRAEMSKSEKPDPKAKQA